MTHQGTCLGWPTPFTGRSTARPKSSGNRFIHVSKFEIKKGMYFLSLLVLCRDKVGASSMVFKRAV